MKTFIEKLLDGVFFLLIFAIGVCYFKFMADAIIKYNYL